MAKKEIKLSESEIMMLIAAIRLSGLNRGHELDSPQNKFQKKFGKIMNKLEDAVDLDSDD